MTSYPRSQGGALRRRTEGWLASGESPGLHPVPLGGVAGGPPPGSPAKFTTIWSRRA